ncbi:MAG TPA: copper oxidase, partial [Thermoanaerobaculia bacterium]
ESQDVVQAFAYFYNGTTSHVPTVNAGSDSFAINYGLAGIGPEVLANRIRVGPTSECDECKFEEFFLSSWAQGDPGLVVDIPANAEESTPCQLDAQFRGTPSTGPQSRPCVEAKKRPTKAFYPDDPSNVYHSYLGDHVRFRILHAGAAVTHVHHHHAHQWLHSPTDQNSNYLDSQSIGPGSSFTLELVYNGSGNRNLTAGDSIFHCHFYPHFASGMWALFRVHDAFEAGTPLDTAMRPRSGVRALPDPQIATGTPIPAIIPLPTLAMAPLPAPVEIVDGQVKLGDTGFPGYPFYIPGIAGHRAPHPPFDFAKDARSSETYDGGLPRHLITDAAVANEQHSLTDWSKDLGEIRAFELPEDGTPSEQRAFAFFGQHLHPSFNQHGQSLPFKVNGLPRGPQPGAPFADPDVLDGQPTGVVQPTYKGAVIQLDAVFNKAGWHYPQQRMMSLWGDVKAFLDSSKPPEPLFFRAHSNDVISYWHTNLVPSYYELDDFQVRTPTDIIGQHIHLVKFDVMASDGAANGFNYEDGTFSPEEVRDRIQGINDAGGLWDYGLKVQTKLTPKNIPQLGDGPGKQWIGAQATVQRWWVDPLMDTRGNDRTYMTVFTHDHFGPSTHQMIGLYGALLVEPDKTNWTSLDGKTKFRDWAVRDDGGPTSYAANIVYTDAANARNSYREFALEWGDLQLVYGPNSKSQPDCYSYVYKG